MTHIITLSSEFQQLIETALEITGKVKFTEKNPTISIPVKGKIILKFGDDVIDNRIIVLQYDDS